MGEGARNEGGWIENCENELGYMGKWNGNGKLIIFNSIIIKLKY